MGKSPIIRHRDKFGRAAEKSSRLSRIAGNQLGLVTIADVLRSGYSQSTFERHVNCSLWVPVQPGVYRSSASQVTFESRCLAVLLSLGPDSAISHRSAAALWKFDGFRPEPIIHVTLRSTKGLTRENGVRVHRYTTIRDGDFVSSGKLRVTSGFRTVIDLGNCASIRELENAVDSGERDRTAPTSEIYARLQQFRKRPKGTSRLDLVLSGLPTGGLHTRLERDFLTISRRIGLLDPQGQVVFRGETKFLARVDFWYKQFDLIVEVSGHRTHSTRQQRHADAARHRAIRATGRDVIEFTSDEVFKQPDLVARDLTANIRFRK